MNITVIDFETYFDVNFSLKKLTIPEYVYDPRFRVHGLAIRWPDGRTEFRADVEAALETLRDRFGSELERTVVVGHHLQFDLFILHHCYNIRPRHFVDTMLLAHHIHGRREGGGGVGASLAALANRYKLASKGELQFMEGVRDPDPEQSAMLSTYARTDVELTASLVSKLLPRITRPEIELPIIMHTVRLFTERGVRIDVAGIDAIEVEARRQLEEVLEHAGANAEAISRDRSFITLLRAALNETGREIPLKPGKKGMIPATAKKDAAMLELLDDDSPRVSALARARLGKKGQDQMLARLDTLRRIAAATGGTLPPYLVYYGAHTGRFAGGGKFNVQNLGRFGLGGRIRELLVPRDGHTLIIADFAQIEARITAWFAGQSDMLAAFAENRDVYSEFATETFGESVRKPRDDDPSDVKDRLGPLRQVGKAAVLGLGFGMGALKFHDTLRSDPTTSRLFDAGVLDKRRCYEIVRAFRQTYDRIPVFWRDLDEAARGIVDGMTSKVCGVTFNGHEDVALVTLPSGRAIRYPNLRFDDTRRSITYIDQFGMENEWTPDEVGLVYGKDTTLYGGKLCENVVQATARDLLVEAVLRLEALGLSVMFHVHDEVVVEVPIGQADAARQLVEQEMMRSPDWAHDLPVGCEVTIADRYGK